MEMPKVEEIDVATGVVIASHSQTTALYKRIAKANGIISPMFAMEVITIRSGGVFSKDRSIEFRLSDGEQAS